MIKRLNKWQKFCVDINKICFTSNNHLNMCSLQQFSQQKWMHTSLNKAKSRTRQVYSVKKTHRTYSPCLTQNKTKCWHPTSLALLSDAIDDPSVSYSAAVVEAEDSGSEQVPVESSDLVGQQHVALVTQEDGTQQQVAECSDITTITALSDLSCW